ncbi:MAG: glycosyltransferase, partial [Lysobacteraceae bacterium]
AIDSVLRQSYPGEVEILVVDDCSTDDSAAIIQAHAGIRYLRTPCNLGVLMATVLGLREASNDLVFFLDGDDLWYPDKLLLAVPRFEEERGLGLLTHDLEYIDGDGHPLAKASRPGQVMRTGAASDDAMVRNGILQHTDYVWLGSAYAIRKSVIDAEGFCDWASNLPDPFNTYQDWPLAFWAASKPNARMGYLPEKLFQYRLHGSNYSGNASDADKALRNIRRTRNTMRAMEEIASASGLSWAIIRTTRRKSRYYDYLMDLYEGHRVAALRGLFASLPYLFSSTESPSKELTRFAGVQAFGLHRFIAMANRRKHDGNAQA